MDKYLETIKHYGQIGLDSLIIHAPSVIIGVIILWVGMKLINRFLSWLDDFFDKRNVDQDLQPFLLSMMSAIMKILLILVCVDIMGIPTGNFVAILAAASFAVGMALQGSLSNFASGVMILLFKPYRQGDLVEIDDHTGHVKEIQIFNTILTGLDHKRYIIPNGTAMSGTIVNLSAEKHLRVELSVNMPYTEDFERVEGIILDALRNTPKVMSDPAPTVGIENYDSHYLVLAVWPFAQTEDYWDVYFHANRNIKRALHENGVQVAYTEGMELGPIGK